MRADAAAVAGVGDHQVVEPRLGHEAKAVEQRARGLDVQVEPLHQQRPARPASAAAARAAAAGRGAAPSARRRARRRRDSTSSRRPARTAARTVSGGSDAGDRLAHQQRLLLPVAAHELRRRQTAEQRSRIVVFMPSLCRGSKRRGRLCDHCPMQINAPCVVTLTWRLEDTLGNLIDELADPIEFFFGGDDLLAEGRGGARRPGSRLRRPTLHLEPEHAFGDYDADAGVLRGARAVPRAASKSACSSTGLPAGCATPGLPADAIYTVTEVYPTHVVLDGNHPLAGIALRLRPDGARRARSHRGRDRSAAASATSALTVLSTVPPSPHTH